MNSKAGTELSDVENNEEFWADDNEKKNNKFS